MEGYSHYLELFNWQLVGTLTSPFKISKHAIVSAVQRMCKKLDSIFENYRLFWIIERHELGGYHVHFLVYTETKDFTNSITKKTIESCWASALGATRKPNTKIKTHEQKTKVIEYILKRIAWNNSQHGFEGNKWEHDY